ncbi:related to SOG2 - key component of the RAM signaling network [Pseudozyma flocculosa]|uniref:Related to SOG2 - key component of the RAM signaling network n=1 Tax=Pseudozyma flocculosa TaxID=84751 RepID=A0A5C3EZ64_9BASI|nr:related to SOG2 - key component of the RAM signaling network [Pseudozyma flocculosa]
MTSYTAIASSEDGRSTHPSSSTSSPSFAAARANALATASSGLGSEWPRTLTEPDNMIKTPTPTETWTSSTLAQYAPSTTGSRSGGSTSQARPISEEELMALVVEKRLKASSEPFQTAAGARNRSGSVAGRERGREDGRSASQTRRDAKEGQEINTRDTLDLCYMRIDRLPDGLVDVIKDDVVRLALGYNLLTKIPDSFVELRCVRYLNVRANSLNSFPAAICKMPSLEILDISRNKLRALPNEPGRLLSLRVLSLNSNKLTRLAPWVAKMKHLRVLKMENNPLEWPPPHISKMPSVVLQKPPSSAGSGAIERDVVRKFEERQMVVWIAKLKNWISDSQAAKRAESLEPSSSAEVETDQPSEEASTPTDILALPVAAPPPAIVEQSTASEDSPASTGHASDQSDGPVTPKNSDQKPDDDATWSQLPTPSSEDRAGSSPDINSRESLLPYDRHHGSPRQLSRDHSHEPVPPIPKQFSPHTPSTVVAGGPTDHGRNNSHTIGQAVSPLQPGPRRTLNPKKSLPDLRLSHEDILTERSQSVPRSTDRSAAVANRATEASARPAVSSQDDDQHPYVAALPTRRPSSAPRRPPLPQSASNPIGYHSKPGGWSSSTPSPSQTSAASSGGGGLRKLSLPTVGATQAAAEAAAAAMASRAPYAHTPPRGDSHGGVPSDKGENVLPAARSDSPTVARNPADFERNSYFRRLSTLPPSTIAKAVPPPVLKFVDGTRGVLFALSQIHAALKQYILFATDERISGQFNRVLDIASGSMTTFINSLDRFDSLSLRGTPEPSVIRGVLMTCKESVVTFRKVVSVLQLQLRALQSSADVRFTRTLLLMLYGSMAEVSNSWTAMAPQVDAVLPYLSADSIANAAANPAHAALARQNSSILSKATAAATNAPSLPSIAETPNSARSVRPNAQPPRPSRRRHAGSFSAHDVAQGANIPPSSSQLQPFNLEDLQASSAYGTPGRSGRRPAVPNGAVPPPHAPSASGSGSDYFSQAAMHAPGPTPGTPGAAASANGRGIGASSAPASPSKNRSNSNASSSGDTSGFMAAGVSGMTPMAPASSAATSVSHQKHGKSLSNGSRAGTGLPPSGLGAKVTIDDHLLVLVDQITGLSAEVWTALLSHLTGLGIESEPATPTGPVTTRSRSNTANSLSDRERGGHGQDAGERLDGLLVVAETTASLTKKLRDLRDLTHSTAELTSRLRETYHCVREEEEQVDVDALLAVQRSSGESDDRERERDGRSGARRSAALELIAQDLAKRLFDESHQFIRAIVNISTLIKTISTSHTFPRELRRSLGEVTHGCSALTVHLLWLSPTSIS